MRVASRILRDRSAQSSQSFKQVSPVYAERGRAVARGSRKFGEAVWRPLVHAGSVLWLEVTGLFFAMFALFFSTSAYKIRQSWHAGPEHERFWLYFVLAFVFCYFTLSSFFRARRRERRKSR